VALSVRVEMSALRPGFLALFQSRTFAPRSSTPIATGDAGYESCYRKTSTRAFHSEVGMTMRLSVAGFVGLMLLAGTFTVPLAAAGEQTPPAPPVGAAAQSKMLAMNMMRMHEQMAAAMKANDAKLDAVLQTLNAAEGAAQIDALVATVNELARQYKAERAHMNEMHQTMCGHMAAEQESSSGHTH
jgi:hypothetical protein